MATTMEFSRRYNWGYTPDPEEAYTSHGAMTEEIKVTHHRTPLDQAVLKAREKVGNNVSAIERFLRAGGYEVSRRRVSKIMDELGIPRIRKG